MQQMIIFNTTVNTVRDCLWMFEMHVIISYLFIHCSQSPHLKLIVLSHNFAVLVATHCSRQRHEQTHAAVFSKNK